MPNSALRLRLLNHFDKSGGKVAYNDPKQVMLRIGRRFEWFGERPIKAVQAHHRTGMKPDYRFKSCLLSYNLQQPLGAPTPGHTLTTT